MWMSRGGGVWEVGSPMGGRGRLRAYLGTAAGVGKTYAMLAEARNLAGSGVDVVVGLVGTRPRGYQAEAGRVGAGAAPSGRLPGLNLR